MRRHALMLAALLVAPLVIALSGPGLRAQAPAPAVNPAEGAGRQGLAVATFAGGCFWCVEADFDKVVGVVETISGFMGGTTVNPTYRQVVAGGTGHAEVVQLTYDPKKVSYQKLLDVFWKSVDPYDGGGQFCDRGDSYRTEIFYHSEEQKALAEASKADLARNGPLKQPIATAIAAAAAFTAAEDYHQDYHTKNPIRYAYYRHGCGRDARLEQIWGKKPTQ